MTGWAALLAGWHAAIICLPAAIICHPAVPTFSTAVLQGRR